MTSEGDETTVSMNEIVDLIPVEIDPDSRYVIVIDGIQDPWRLELLAEHIKMWWDSQEKFFVLGAHDGMTVRFERLEPEGRNKP